MNPGACIIRLITAVIYGLRNKLECFPLLAFPAQSSVQSQTRQLSTGLVNYGRNNIYDTGPWTQSYKTFFVLNYDNLSQNQ